MPPKTKPEAHLQEVTNRVVSLPAVVLVHRKAFSTGYSFSQLPFLAQLQIWDDIWKQTGSYWVRLQAFFFLEQYVRKTEYHQLIWKTSLSWQEDVNDWSLCDALAKVNTKVLETHTGSWHTVFRKGRRMIIIACMGFLLATLTLTRKDG